MLDNETLSRQIDQLWYINRDLERAIELLDDTDPRLQLIKRALENLYNGFDLLIQTRDIGETE